MSKKKKDYNYMWKSKPEVMQDNEVSELYILGHKNISNFIPELDGEKVFESLIYLIRIKCRFMERVFPLIINFEIDKTSDVNYETQNNAYFTVVENTCHIQIFLQSFENKDDQISNIEKFNHALLHEIGHYFYFMNNFLNNHKYNFKKLEEYFNKEIQEKAALRKLLSEEDYSFYLNAANLHEINADYFYFENISLYQNI